jgi:hypothetical protein
VFDAIKERRHFNFKRLRDRAQSDGLEVRRFTFVGSIPPRICFLTGEGARRVIIHESQSVSQAWEYLRGWEAGSQWGQEVANR